MKKVIYYVGVALLASAFVACGPKKETKSSEEYVANETATEKPADGDPIAMGEAAVKQSDCKTCHHKTNKLIGPAHLEVAKKYDFTKANVEMLAKKIIEGGQGNWGEIPMAAHPDLSKADAERMARYVLSLDGEKEH